MNGADLKLGQLVTGKPERDAVHIAVIAVKAGEDLPPGEHVSMRDGKAHSADRAHAIGVVDPFLEYGPTRGDHFWLLLTPGSITSLRHEWGHPAFAASELTPEPSAGSKDESMAWLRDCAEGCDVSVSRLIEMARLGAVVSQGTEYGNDIDREAFWLHVERVTGEVFSSAHKGDTYFSCSC